MIGRALAEAVVRDVIAACDPAARVRAALADPEVASRLAGRRRFAFAVGKAARAMACGAGEVAGGLAIVPAGGGGALPRGWRLLEAAHPEPDARSVAAGQALHDLVAALRDTDVLLVLLSGGASALAELPIVPLDQLVATVRAVMAAGAAIDEINAVRGALSAIKAGQLARAAAAPIVTLAVSDVIGDALAVIGSGPTIGPWLDDGLAVDDDLAARRARASAILARHGVVAPPLLASLAAGTIVRAGARLGSSPARVATAPAGAPVRPTGSVGASPALAGEPPSGAIAGNRAVRRSDLAAVIAPMASAAHAAVRALAARGIAATLLEAPMSGDVEAVARALVGALAGGAAALVAWGEPTLRIPPVHGSGGRAQQLALLLARALRGTARSALVVGTDGIDGPPPADRPAPAGAWVDGTTWDRIVAAGRDPGAALATCDAGPALAAVGALLVTGPSGINHADLAILG